MVGGRFDVGKHIREKQIGSAAIGAPTKIEKEDLL